MKQMRLVLAGLLAASLLSVAGCGSQGEAPANTPAATGAGAAGGSGYPGSATGAARATGGAAAPMTGSGQALPPPPGFQAGGK